MTDRLLLTDELIRDALTPSDTALPDDLHSAVRAAVAATPRRRFWWSALRPVVGPFGPSPAVRTLAVLAALLAIAALMIALAGARRASPFIGDGSMFHGGAARTGEVDGIGPITSPTRIWSLQLGGPLANAMPALADGRLYVADGQGNVAELDAATGTRGWSTRVPKPATSPAIADGVLVLGAGDGVYGLDARADAILWRMPTAGPVLSEPAILDGTVFVGLPDGSLVALDLRSGRVLWRTPIGGAIDRAPAVADGLVFAGGAGGTFAAVDAASGRIVWRAALGSGQVSTPAARDGTVYVTSGLDDTALPHVLFAFDEHDGRQLWTFTAAGGQALYIGAVGSDLVYAVGLDGTVNALRDGAATWQDDLGAPIGSGATLSHGVLYVSASNGTIAAIDAATGSKRWTIQVQGDPGPVVLSGGRLWTGTTLGVLACLGEASASSAASPP
jgi:outer membrane protein assembly factor BamB